MFTVLSAPPSLINNYLILKSLLTFLIAIVSVVGGSPSPQRRKRKSIKIVQEEKTNWHDDKIN